MSRPLAYSLLVTISLIAILNPIFFAAPDALVDDAFIYFRYVDNFLASGELTWNIGMEKVEGYTSFLYTMILTIPAALQLDLEHSAHMINIGLYAVVMLGVGVFRTCLKNS